MITKPVVDTRSEEGMALVVVLLLMAVLSGLATGFAMNGQTESAMAVNEQYYSGARAAAEAGINRATAAIRAEDDVELLSGVDGLVDAANPGAAVNADNGDVNFMLAGASPYPLDAAGRYRYTIDIFDDDDPALYGGVPLAPEQLAAMVEDGDPTADGNTRLILRATGFGPSNTVVTVSRLILTQVIPIPGSTVNPAIIVDGNVSVDGNLNLRGAYGSIHANGNLTVNGNSATVEGDATASGEFVGPNLDAGGSQGGGYASINLPEITASDYVGIADYKLTAQGVIVDAATNLPCPGGCPGTGQFTFTDPDGILGPMVGTWTLGGNAGPEGTFYVEGKVLISGSPTGTGAGNPPLKLTLIATGSISITGNPKLSPDTNLDGGNPEAIQFVTDGDLDLNGTGNLNTTTQVEGQIFVKEQIHMSGNPAFTGRIIVQDDPSVFDDVLSNSIDGTPTITYDGTLPGYVIPPTTEYTYNVAGWIEGQ